LGKSVKKAVENINKKIGPRLKGLDPTDQLKIDKAILDLDGSENKKNLGANATLAVSLANSKSSAISLNKPLYKNLGKSFSLPNPLMNIINGGAHADNDLNIQEFMIRPDSAINFMDAVEKSFLVIQNLKILLKSKKMLTNVGDEGGFAPSINTNEEALELIVKAIEKSKLVPGKDIVICLDVAANELVNKEGQYSIQSSNFISVENVIDYYKKLTSSYPIKSIEDPFAEEDWDSWKKITAEIGKNVQIVGDDLFVTNSKRLKKGIDNKSANSILVKPNQIGTLSETLEVVTMAKKANFNTIISHRSGDTEDTFIADLAVAIESSQIKTGSLARSERVAKYNRLLRIEEELGNQVKMAKI
jgi:enolase